MARKIVFLDFDGVLNSAAYDRARTPNEGNIDETRMPLLRALIEQTGAEIVLSTSWREHWSSSDEERDEIGDEIDGLFAAYGMRISDKTPTLKARADEILAWLSLHPEVSSFVILDDIAFGWGELVGHLIRTNPRIGRGLGAHHVEKAISLLNHE